MNKCNVYAGSNTSPNSVVSSRSTSNVGKPEISMAPLVDIVFLLLIFFMVTTIFPEDEGLMIEKPSAENATSISKDQFVVKLDQSGISYINDTQVTIDDVKRLVKSAVENDSHLTVTIHTDRRAQTEALINVIDAAKTGGATKIGIAADEK